MGKQIEDAQSAREVDAGRAEELRYIEPKPEETYLKGAAFGTMDMNERLQLLNQEGLARALLYPTLGLLWEAETMDAEISAAYCTAYNRWIADSAVTRAAVSCRSPICRSAIRRPPHANSNARSRMDAKALSSRRSISRGFRMAMRP